MKMEGFRPFPWSRHARTLWRRPFIGSGWCIKGGNRDARFRKTTSKFIRRTGKQTARGIGSIGRFSGSRLGLRAHSKRGIGPASRVQFFLPRRRERNQESGESLEEKLSHQQVVELESLIGPTLQEFGYALTVDEEQRRARFRLKLLASLYPRFLWCEAMAQVEYAYGPFR